MEVSQPPNGILIGSAVFQYTAALSQCVCMGWTTPKIAHSPEPLVTHGSLSLPHSAPQTTSRSVQPFSRGSRTWTTDSQNRATLCLAVGRYHCDAAEKHRNSKPVRHYLYNSTVLRRCANELQRTLLIVQGRS